MKIQSHLSIRQRKEIRRKLNNSSYLHKTAISLHRAYCNLTGFLHVMPDFFILGVEKGGTSSLYSYLIRHPMVFSAVTKEINFFNKYYDRGINWYKICFPFCWQRSFTNKFSKNFLTGEASVRYFDYPHAPKRIKKFIPHAKFILLLRNPVDRAYSQHSMVTRGGNERLSFEHAINQEQERVAKDYELMKNDPSYFSDNYFRHAYLDRGIYVDKIKRWMDVFPREQFLILQSEKFFEDPAKYYKDILNFLNIPSLNFEEYGITGKINTKSPMDSQVRKQLIDFFKPHNQRLYKFLEMKFDWDD